MESWSSSWGPAPRWATERTPERPTFGPAVAKIAERLGTPLFPAQAYVYDVALEVQSEAAGDPYPGEWAYEEIADLEPRRSGKTFKIGPLVAHRCGSGRRNAWITAQKRENAVRRWAEACKQLKASPIGPDLRQKIGNTKETLEFLKTGGEFRPFSPKADSMHGDEPDLVIVDELWAFSLTDKADIEQGYKPVWSVKSGQAWLMSAAGTPSSAWLNGLASKVEKAAEVGRRTGFAGFHWGVPDSVGGVPVDELPDAELLDVVLDCHPRRDNGLRPAYLAEQLGDMGRTDFLRAYGNRTAGVKASSVIDAAAWRRAASARSIPPTGRVALGFDVDPERREGAVSAAWRDPISGIMLTEVIRTDPGTRWVARFVADVWARQSPGVVAVRYAGPARDVADELERIAEAAGLDVTLLRVPAGDYAAACARFADELADPDAPSVLHRAEPALVDAMHAASRRRMPAAGSYVWDRRGNDPITTLAAHTLAVWGADHMPAEVPAFRIA